MRLPRPFRTIVSSSPAPAPCCSASPGTALDDHRRCCCCCCLGGLSVPPFQLDFVVCEYPGPCFVSAERLHVVEALAEAFAEAFARRSQPARRGAPGMASPPAFTRSPAMRVRYPRPNTSARINGANRARRLCARSPSASGWGPVQHMVGVAFGRQGSGPTERGRLSGTGARLGSASRITPRRTHFGAPGDPIYMEQGHSHRRTPAGRRSEPACIGDLERRGHSADGYSVEPGRPDGVAPC